MHTNNEKKQELDCLVHDMPEPMYRLVHATVGGPITVIANRSWAGPDRPQVWEVERGDDQRYFVKRFAGPKGYHRATHALRHWAPGLGSERAPRLLGRDDDQRCIILSPVAGNPVRGLALSATDICEVYRQAGELLACMHALSHGDQDSSPDETWEEKAAKALDGAAGLITAEEQALMHDLVDTPPPVLPNVVVHADFQPRNWLWDPRRRRVNLIDFERACTEPATRRDLCRMEYRLLVEGTDERSAFYHGYGRNLADNEERACIVYAALDALGALRWGADHEDQETIGYATTMMHALTRRSSQ